MFDRRLQPNVLKDLNKKMVMIAGPRQCGKTTLSKTLARRSGWKSAYYNWDIDADRLNIMQSRLDAGSRLWILDELHKYRKWRNWLKGKFDQYHPTHAILVTGSAKLDAYSRGGDSLQGRYYLYRMHPFTFTEVLGNKVSLAPETVFACDDALTPEASRTFADLLRFGGFPEPFSSASEREAARWRLSYGSRLVREEIRTLQQIQNLDGMELLLDRLPDTVGSVLSINSLREDLQVAFETVRNWLNIFERLYAVFRVTPFGAPRIKAVKKERKLYFWDWARVEREDARLENLVALHLLRLTHWYEDVEGEKWELRYFRDVTGHEVDFIMVRKGKPFCAVEVKTGERGLDSNLKYLLERVRIPYAFQLSLKEEADWAPAPINGCRIRVLPAAKFLAHLA